MKYIVEVEGELPPILEHFSPTPLMTCGQCQWWGVPDRNGLARCYWDSDRGRIYPEDYYCKLAAVDGEATK